MSCSQIQGHSSTSCASVDFEIEEIRLLRQTRVQGLPLLKSAVHELLYICDHSVFIEASKLWVEQGVSQFGVALLYLYVGNGFCYVWHLQKPVGNAFTESDNHSHPQKKVWFFTQQSTLPTVKTVLTEQLKCQLLESWLQVDDGSGNTSSNTSFYSETVQAKMVSRNLSELQMMCPLIRSSQTVSSILRNSMKFVHEIRIDGSSFGEVKKQGSNLFERMKCIRTILNLLQEVCSEEFSPTVAGSSLSRYKQLDVAECDNNCASFSSLAVSQAITEQPMPIDEIQMNFVKHEVNELLEPIEPKEEVNAVEEINVYNVNCGSGICEDRKEVLITPMFPNKVTSSRKPNFRIHTERTLLVECPLCGMSFRSAKKRVKSLISHIHRRHASNRDLLLQFVNKKYTRSNSQETSRRTYSCDGENVQLLL